MAGTSSMELRSGNFKDNDVWEPFEREEQSPRDSGKSFITVDKLLALKHVMLQRINQLTHELRNIFMPKASIVLILKDNLRITPSYQSKPTFETSLTLRLFSEAGVIKINGTIRILKNTSRVVLKFNNVNFKEQFCTAACLHREGHLTRVVPILIDNNEMRIFTQGLNFMEDDELSLNTFHKLKNDPEVSGLTQAMTSTAAVPPLRQGVS